MNKFHAGVATALTVVIGAIGGCADEQAAKSDPIAMMTKLQELGTPGPQHRLLGAFAGKWSTEVKFWIDPTQQEPHISQGTMTVASIMNGRYIHGDYQGTFMMLGHDGKPQQMTFTGHMLRGYSNADKEYQSVWVDSESTSVLSSIGQPGSDGKSINSVGNGMGPDSTGKLVKGTMWEKLTMVSDDKWVQEMWSQNEDGPRYKNMEVTYTRTGR